MAKRSRDLFVGREGEMRQVKETVCDVVWANMTGKSERLVSFVVFEGGSGIGKTRCLQEVAEQVQNWCTPQDKYLLNLYNTNSVHEVFITFNGRGSPVNHMPPSDAGGLDGGRFLELTLMSELLYGRPFFSLKPDERARVESSTTFADSMTVARDVLLKKGGDSSPRVLVLWVLLDEMQLLAMQLGNRGTEFIKAMCDAVGRYMQSNRSRDLILLPCLAGCSVPEVGSFGASNWPRLQLVLSGLSSEAVAEIARHDLCGKHSSLTSDPAFKALLDDCMGVPRFIKWGVEPLDQLDEDVSNSAKVETSRFKLLGALREWANNAIEFNKDTEQLRQAMRHCLVGAKVTDMEMKAAQCIRGYVYWRVVGGETVFQAPVFLLHYLAQKLSMYQRIVELIPKHLNKAELEWACLEMLHARLCIARGRTISVSELFPGSFGVSLPEVMRVPSAILLREEERQFLEGTKRFRVLEDRYKVEVRLPWFGVVLKCKANNGVVDGRCFLEMTGPKGTTLEMWIQVKGEQEFGLKDLQALCNAAFAKELEVAGRERLYVIFLPYVCISESVRDKFMRSQLELERSVRVLDSTACAEFMPFVMQRSRRA